ncbi:hypothetical protein JB92DRAFT_3155157 [Gautieria morchelliformis]|nr:hypothetical protein JB92DRAFT_3155157 [Gautieria morchelliformis]
MSLHSLFAISLLAFAHAQTPASSALEPLASKKFTFPNIPYQVTGDQGGIRGPQAGYNICNSTTEGSQSLCQTLFLNSMSDFCIWSSSKQDDTIGVSEAYEVAWCTKPGHGSRLIPPGAITGAQWLYAKNYLQVVGFIDQSMVNLDPTDMGGELDPHGADEQGNPLGGIVFTNGFGQSASSFAQQVSSNSSGSTSFTQVVEWIDFIGSGVFCLKMCNPNDPNGPQLCNHIYDEIGCNFNALADYGQINGTYEVCDSDDMTPPGVFTTAPGQTTTWFQPQTGPVVPPYTTSIPASSNCQTFSSNQLFLAAPTPTTTGSAASGSGSGGGTTAAASRSGSGSAASATASPGGAVAIGAPVGGLAAALFGAFITLMA